MDPWFRASLEQTFLEFEKVTKYTPDPKPFLDSEKKFGLKYLLIPRKLLVFFLTANTPDMTGPNDTLLNYFIIKMAS